MWLALRPPSGRPVVCRPLCADPAPTRLPLVLAALLVVVVESKAPRRASRAMVLRRSGSPARGRGSRRCRPVGGCAEGRTAPSADHRLGRAGRVKRGAVRTSTSTSCTWIGSASSCAPSTGCQHHPAPASPRRDPGWRAASGVARRRHAGAAYHYRVNGGADVPLLRAGVRR